MKIPQLPEGWWIAYIYPMPAGIWAIDARSFTCRVAAEAGELEDAIALAIEKIHSEDWEWNEPRMVQNSAVDIDTLDLLSSLGVEEKPLVKRKL